MLLCAGLLAALSATHLLTPGLMTWLFGIAPDVSAHVMARRAGVLFFLLACLFFIVRSADAAPLRRRISGVTAAAMGGLAVLGLVEFLFGRVGPGILLPVAAETGIAALFLPHALPRALPRP
jgi:hypothetical protein